MENIISAGAVQRMGHLQRGRNQVKSAARELSKSEGRNAPKSENLHPTACKRASTCNLKAFMGLWGLPVRTW